LQGYSTPPRAPLPSDGGFGAFFAAKAGFFVMAIIPISTTRVLTENTVGYLDELSSMSSIKYENLK
jgi:hypothetical protein